MTDLALVDALVAGLGIPLPDDDVPVPRGTYCAMTGAPLAEGVPLKAILSDATADIATMFPLVGASQWVAPQVAALFRTKLTGNVLCLRGFDGVWRLERPLVNRQSAIDQDRPCWSDIVRFLPQAAQTVAIFSDDVQRRLWPLAACSAVGPTWRVYLHAAGCGSQLVTLHHTRLVTCLEKFEDAYNAGFPKEVIRTGLLTLSQQRRIAELGVAQVATLEAALFPFRGTPEMDVAYFIAQKEIETT